MTLNLLLETQPPDIWHDTVFQLIIVVVATLVSAFVGWAIAIEVYRRQKRLKEIIYHIVSDDPLTSINQVQGARRLVFKVWNSGNVAVKRDDYEEPITFAFQRGTIVSSDLLETEPSDLISPKIRKTFLTVTTNSVELPPFLLNPKQSISLLVLLTGAKQSISVRGRIIDGKVIKFHPNTQFNSKQFTLGVLGVGSSLAAILAFLGLTAKEAPVDLVYQGILGELGFYGLSAVFIVALLVGITGLFAIAGAVLEVIVRKPPNS